MLLVFFGGWGFVCKCLVWTAGRVWKGGEAGEDGLLDSPQLSAWMAAVGSSRCFLFCFKELMLCRESWDVLVCIQECFHWLLSPLLVTQWVAGRIKAQYLSEPSLLSLIIQQVLKCLRSVSVWSASLAALPVISVTALNSHQACALLLVTNAQCIYLIGYCSLYWFRPERSQRKGLGWFLVRPCWVPMRSRGI